MVDGPEPRGAVTASVKPLLVLSKIRRVLDVVAEQPDGVRFQHVRDTSGLPASTTVRLLQNLVAEGLLDRDGDHYFLGEVVRRWAARSQPRGLLRSAQSVLERLRDQTGETAVLFVRDGAHRVLVALAETRHQVVRLMGVGQVMPLHAGSAGKVFLAFDPGIDLSTVKLVRLTEHTIATRSGLRTELAAIRSRGCAISLAERDEGTASISAPVFDASGAVAAAVGIGCPMQRLSSEPPPEWVTAILDAASALSRALGHDAAAPSRQKGSQ